MAQKLEAYTFPKPGPVCKYPFDDWLDGGIWKLTSPEDFSVRPSSLRTNLFRQAGIRGGRVRTSIDGDSVIIQFIPGDSGES